MLQVHQAYFGAVNGTSHGQLASSLIDKRLRSFLAGFTDRPGVPPTGYTLQPYLAATSFDNYYLICLTWPDTAVERQGMVFTHVLILPINQLVEDLALGPVLDLLLTALPGLAERPTNLTPLTLSAHNRQPFEPAGEVPESWLAVVNHLLDASEPTPVYMLSDATHFQVLLEALWQGLPPSLRAKLSWGIRFTPPGSKDVVPLLVRVPCELEVKWRGMHIIPLATVEKKTPMLPVDQLIFGKAGGSFREFVASIEVEPQSFDTLKRCQRAFQQHENLLADKADTGELLALVRTLRQLQPDPAKAIVVKHQAVEALTEALLIVGSTEAMALRNLQVEAFQTGLEQLGKVVRIVVQRIVKTANPDSVLQSSLLNYMAEADPAIIENWWREAATTAFIQTLGVSSIRVANVIWVGLSDTYNVRAYLLGVIPTTAAWEQVLGQTVPVPLPAVVADAVTVFCVERKWWDLFMAAVGAAYTPAEALLRQVKAEKKLHLNDSPRVLKLAERVLDKELVALTVEEATPQLIELAGERCGSNASLLAIMNVRQKSWRTIWSVSLTYSKSIIAGLPIPVETIHAFLSEVAVGRADEQLPLELIAASSFANVMHLPERAELWGKLPTALRPHFVAATLDAFVEEIISGKVVGDIEHDLTVSAKGLEFNTKLLNQKRNDLVAVLTVDTILHNLSDPYLKDYITNLPTTTAIAALELGRLIGQRQWKLSADALLSKAMHTADFRPGLQECSGMFSSVTKILNHKVFDHNVTTNDVWDALTDTLSQLYPNGPDQDHIWKRAGGDATLLTNDQSRKEQWVSAIRMLKHGGGGNTITAKSLIHCALEDFGKNPTLLTFSSSLHLFKTR